MLPRVYLKPSAAFAIDRRPSKLKQTVVILRQPAGLVAAAVTIGIVHLQLADPMFSVTSRLLASILAMMAYYSVLQVSLSTERNRLPFRELYAVLFYVFYGFPVFWEDELPVVGSRYVPSTGALDLSLFAAVLSLAVFFCVYPLGLRLGVAARPIVVKLLPKKLPPLSSGWFLLFLLVPVVLAVTYSFALMGQTIPTQIERIIYFIASPMLLLAIALRLADVTKLKRYKFAATVILIMTMFIALLTGMLETFLLPVAIVTVSRWISFKPTHLLWLVLGLVLFVVLNPAKLNYRSETGTFADTQGRALTVEDRLDIWGEQLSSKWISSENIQDNLDASRSRISDLLPVAQVMDTVPSSIPFASGQPWMAIPYSLIPRVVWPNKPDLTQMSNGQYAVTFNRLSPEQAAVTAFNVPQLADAYWNFGWIGIVIVAVLAGLSIGLKAGAFETKSWASCAIGIIFFTALRPQSDLNTLLVGSIQMFVGAVVLLSVLQLGGRVLRLARR